jgi:ATP-dependent Clp protease, protease subunit
MNRTPTEADATFYATIDPVTSEALLTRVGEHAENGVETVHIVMSSPGGKVASGMELYENLRESKVEIVTENRGEVASMANVVFLAGDRRLAYPEATFRLHPVAWPIGGLRLDAADLHTVRTEVESLPDADPDLLRELDEAIEHVTEADAQVREVLEERTKMSRRLIESLVKQDTTMNASEALAAGIVHKIVPRS